MKTTNIERTAMNLGFSLCILSLTIARTPTQIATSFALGTIIATMRYKCSK